MREFVDFIKENWGNDLSLYSESFLEKTIHTLLEANGIKDIDAYRGRLIVEPLLLKQLLDALNVHYSTFFRDPLVFSIIGKKILPEIIANLKGNRRLRIWSACCSNGEEPYSLGILMNELSITNKNIQVDIFATDIEAEVLKTAAEGVYGRESMYYVPLGFASKYFELDEGNYIISDSIKRKVQFSEYNIMDNNYSNPPESIFGGFDLVLCSNVLYYYSIEQQKEIIKKLTKSMRHGSYLITDEITMGSGIKVKGLEQYSHNTPIYKLDKLKEST